MLSFTVLAASLPLIACIHAAYGFDMLFTVMAIAFVIFAAAAFLSKTTSGPSTPL